MIVIKNECMILLKNVLWCQLQFISLNFGLYMCQGEFVVGDKCVVGHFWFIHRTDAIFLPLPRAWGGEGYDEAGGLENFIFSIVT